MRFLGLVLRMRFPTAKTRWPYREALAKAGGERAGRLGWLAGHEKLAAIVGV